MAKASPQRIREVLLKNYGRTFGEELGLNLEAGAPASLYRLLCAAQLFSTRIGHTIALEAAKALAQQHWTTPERMAGSTWEQRVKTLDDAGYVRYDERTSTMLGENAVTLLDRYKGDLRKLREEARRNPERERELLKELKGIGDVATDIFFREAQVAWPELFPFADRKARESAKALGLPSDPDSLARLAHGPQNLARLVAALVRVQLGHKRNEVLKQAAEHSGRKHAGGGR
jgi:hypothetical protein